jgi:hypothetical protein
MTGNPEVGIGDFVTSGLPTIHPQSPNPRATCCTGYNYAHGWPHLWHETRPLGELAWAGMHVGIEPANRLSVVDYIPGLDRWVSGGYIQFLAEADVEKCRGRIHDSFLHMVVGQVGADALRIEVVLRRADQLHEMVIFKVRNLRRIGICFALFGQ